WPAVGAPSARACGKARSPTCSAGPRRPRRRRPAARRRPPSRPRP
ncbi:MAG: hypothetical protein AVDCRST_MAG13-806, partial [uncultured Solirubrobacteraceae bacterium]